LDIAPIAHFRLMEGLLDGVIVLDKANRIVDYNPAAQKILNLSTAVIGQSLHHAGFQNPDLIVLDQNIHAEKSEIQIENYDLREFEVRTLALLDNKNQPTGKLVTLHDISEYRQAQEQIRRSEEQYRLLFDNAVESILVVQDRKIVFCNPITSELTGYPLEEIINESFVKFIYPEDIPMILENYRKRVEGVNLQGRYQFRLVRKDLSFRWVETSGIRIDWEGELATLHFIMDVTDRKKAEVALEFRSTHDILTGLYNRQYFEQEIDRLQNSRRQPVSILVMDMNGLKEINDSQGHAAGDEQLRVAAREISKAFRLDDIVARIGGDEFVILLPETDTTTTIRIVERVKAIIHDFNQLNPEHNPISFAIGFATSETTPNLRDVFRNADRDMYIQKAIHYAVE
jgi:diguanylate cyclase (GGDEF)-like protein/PAS domain S-box-containing protein